MEERWVSKGLRREGCEGRSCYLVRGQVPAVERVPAFLVVDGELVWEGGARTSSGWEAAAFSF